MGKFWVIIEVLYKGRELQNKELWKNAQAVTGALLPMFAAINIFFPDLQISTMDTHTIINGIVAVFGVAGTYLTVATSKSVGISKKIGIKN